MTENRKTIVVLGASGLIGEVVAADLIRRGFVVIPVARRFTKAQREAFGEDAREFPFVSVEADKFERFIIGLNADMIINCVGVLQDGPRGRVLDAHSGFAKRLVAFIEDSATPILLVHLSIPGREGEDATAFSRTKREAEHIITDSRAPHVVLRPGFVIAPAAYGGSALVRALAALPFRLPTQLADKPFAITAVADISATIAALAQRWRNGEQDWRTVWDVMDRGHTTIGAVVETFRRRFGGPLPLVVLPAWWLDIGARCADFAGLLGWSPPIRSTALAELRRGVTGNPEPWILETGIEPTSLNVAVAGLPVTVQERWFARLYLCKALILGGLALFWSASGIVALSLGFDAAANVLQRHGAPPDLARIFVLATSILDIAVGVMIGLRRACRAGLLAGLATSFAYLVGATFETPELWADPLGPLMKIGPVIALMLTALAILDDR